MDKATEDRIKLLHPKVRDEVMSLVNIANSMLSKHSEIRIVQGLRTVEEQNALYAQGRTRPGKKVTNARGGYSWHNYGLAIDFCLLINDKEISWDVKRDWDGDRIADWMEVVSVFRKAGWEWGGTWKFKDNPHFEKKFNLTISEALKRHKNKNFIEGTRYIKI